MVYLEYHKETKQVVEIHETEPFLNDENYDYAMSDHFLVGDEFELSIWINDVDVDKNLISYSAVRNNPNARRLLQENKQLKEMNELLTESLIDFKLAYMSVPCQSHQEYPVLVEGLLEGAKADE